MGTERSIAQLGAAIVGVVYVGAGLIGFAITGFGGFVTDTGDTLLGFDINPFHNVVHLGIGAYLLLAARLGRTATEGALIGGGIFYLLAAYLGFENRLQIISISDALASDQFLHIASGVTALGLGLVSSLVGRSEGSGDSVQKA
ncbi:MAG: DUF4383 domain-containing protein [Solirubrobacteraceae bacterium]